MKQDWGIQTPHEVSGYLLGKRQDSKRKGFACFPFSWLYLFRVGTQVPYFQEAICDHSRTKWTWGDRFRGAEVPPFNQVSQKVTVPFWVEEFLSSILTLLSSGCNLVNSQDLCKSPFWNLRHRMKAEFVSCSFAGLDSKGFSCVCDRTYEWQTGTVCDICHLSAVQPLLYLFSPG